MSIPNTEIISILEKARKLIEHGWCQRALAQDISEETVDPLSLNATSFSLSGAIRRAARGHPKYYTLCFQCEDALMDTAPTPFISGWNDLGTTTQQDVVDLLTNTIKRLTDD